MNSGHNYLITAVIRIMQIQLYRSFGPIMFYNHVSATEKESQKKRKKSYLESNEPNWGEKINQKCFLSISDKKES